MKEMLKIAKENWLRMAAHVAVLLGLYIIAKAVLTLLQRG